MVCRLFIMLSQKYRARKDTQKSDISKPLFDFLNFWVLQPQYAKVKEKRWDGEGHIFFLVDYRSSGGENPQLCVLQNPQSI
jgi:hypothetical protein